MKKKEQFTSPSVLQAVPLTPEEDLLLGTSADLLINAAGHDYFEFNMDGGNGMGSYSADDWYFE